MIFLSFPSEVSIEVPGLPTDLENYNLRINRMCLRLNKHNDKSRATHMDMQVGREVNENNSAHAHMYILYIASTRHLKCAPQLFHVVSRATSSNKQLAASAAIVLYHRISL